MSDWTKLNLHRVRDGVFGSSPSDGFNGAFCLKINGLPIKVIASDGMGWQHVSVSIHGSVNVPSWSIMCQVKDLFWNDGDWVVQFHPAKSEYVNNHPGCLHLWRPTDAVLPTLACDIGGNKGGASVKIKFEKRDCFVGLFWDRQRVTVHTLCGGAQIRETVIRFYVCIVPCFPISFDVSFFKEVAA